MNPYLRAAKKDPKPKAQAKAQLDRRKGQGKPVDPGKPEKPAEPEKP